MSALRDHPWKSKYHSDAGSLVKLFYEPALACAVRYDRTSGYFTAGSLTLAARGVENLIRNKGRMRLIVGCTLGPDEVRAIEQGLALAALLGRSELLPPTVEVKRIANHEYELMMPGMKEPLRVTTSRERFEENPGTYELWTPGSPLFPERGAVPPPSEEVDPQTTLRELLGSQG